MAKPTYNLPPRVTGMPDANAPGVWLEVEQLDALANSLLVGAKIRAREDIKSIPDPWAQLLVFERALIDLSHPLHAAVVTQWRGLLATLALQPEFEARYTLSTESFDLKGASATSLFARTLLYLQPQRRLTPGVTWGAATALILHGVADDRLTEGRSTPIGFFSPTTLLAAGRDIAQVTCAGVPWLEKGLEDPTTAELSDRHFRILADYLTRLSTSLRALSASHVDVALRAGLLDRLRDFVEACEPHLPARGMPLQEAQIDLSWPSEVYRQALGTTKKAAMGPMESEAQLALSGPMAALFNGAILIDAELATTLGRAPASIQAWGRHSLADALVPATFDIIRTEAEAAGWLIIEPKDLFTSTYVVVKQPMVNHAHPQGLKSSLLPVSPLVLLLLPGAQVSEALKVSLVGSSASVRLGLPLLSGETHVLRRQLPALVKDEAAPQVPDDLAFWPNFQAPGWRWTFMHYTANVIYYMRPRFAVTAAVISSQIRGAASNMADRARWVRRWSSPNFEIDDLFGWSGSGERAASRKSTIKGAAGEVLVDRISFQATENTVGELHHLPGGAEAVFLARMVAPGRYAPAGMALVKFDEPSSSALDAHVAVDFGSTNTVVYAKVPGNDPEQLGFEDRIRFPFEVEARQAERRSALAGHYLSFFPMQRHDTPLPTVSKLREFRPALPSEVATSLETGLISQVGFADTILFVPNFDEFAIQKDQLGGGDNLMSLSEQGLLKYRLKWGKTPVEKTLAGHFLRQIMMMATAELVARGIALREIKWSFSWPQSFGLRPRRSLEAAISEAWQTLFPATQRQEGLFLRKTEGAAAAHFFMERPDAPEKVMLMLDIGGATTDIALWRNGRPLWRNSFRLAGGDFFTAYLANNPAILTGLDMREVATSLGSSRLNAEGLRDFIELYVNKPSFAAQFARNFRLLDDQPEGRGLELAATVALGGLLYYVSLVLKGFISPGLMPGEEGEVPLQRADLDNITIAFAGRGASLFRQLHTPGADSILARLVRMVVAGAVIDPSKINIGIKFSPLAAAKHEVARGLLSERRAAEGGESLLAILGEEVVYGGDQEVRVDPWSTLSSLREAREISEVTLANFEQFLGQLGMLTGVRIDTKRRNAHDNILRRVRQDLADALEGLDEEAFMAPDTQPFDPPFILALRELVRLMTLPVAERDKVLVVREDQEA